MSDEVTPVLTVHEVAARVAAGAVLVDVREDDEFAAGHVPGAVHLPLSQVTRRPLPPAQELLMVCRSGRRSQQATTILLAAGVSACNVEGGMLAWQRAGLALVSDTDAAPEVR